MYSAKLFAEPPSAFAALAEIVDTVARNGTCGCRVTTRIRHEGCRRLRVDVVGGLLIPECVERMRAAFSIAADRAKLRAVQALF